MAASLQVLCDYVLEHFYMYAIMSNDCIVGVYLTVFQLCILFWQQRSNIFAPPDGGLTCLVWESNTAATLAEPTSNPLTAIYDDTWWYYCNHSSGKQKVDKTNIFQKTGSASVYACPAPWRCGYRMERSVKEALDTVFMPVEDIWFGFPDTTEACECTFDSQ